MTLDPQAIVGGLGGLLTVFVGWLWTQMDSRVKNLEENFVRRKEFDELRDDVRGIYGKIDANKDELIDALLKGRG